MRDRFSGLMVTAAAVSAAISVPVTLLSIAPASAQTPQRNPPGLTAQDRVGEALRTPWGEPDLQGIWTDEFDTPLQRSPKFANQEFFTEAQRAELDQQRSAM